VCQTRDDETVNQGPEGKGRCHLADDGGEPMADVLSVLAQDHEDVKGPLAQATGAGQDPLTRRKAARRQHQ
jgi:hypothetical protein